MYYISKSLERTQFNISILTYCELSLDAYLERGDRETCGFVNLAGSMAVASDEQPIDLSGKRPDASTVPEPVVETSPQGADPCTLPGPAVASFGGRKRKKSDVHTQVTPKKTLQKMASKTPVKIHSSTDKY